MKEIPEMPYSLQLAIMSMGGNDRGVIQVFSKCINDMTKKLLDVAESYDYEDLPFVVASMQLTARSLSTLLDDRGSPWQRRWWRMFTASPSTLRS